MHMRKKLFNHEILLIILTTDKMLSLNLGSPELISYSPNFKLAKEEQKKIRINALENKDFRQYTRSKEAALYVKSYKKALAEIIAAKNNSTENNGYSVQEQPKAQSIISEFSHNFEQLKFEAEYYTPIPKTTSKGFFAKLITGIIDLFKSCFCCSPAKDISTEKKHPRQQQLFAPPLVSAPPAAEPSAPPPQGKADDLLQALQAHFAEDQSNTPSASAGNKI